MKKICLLLLLMLLVSCGAPKSYERGSIRITQPNIQEHDQQGIKQPSEGGQQAKSLEENKVIVGLLLPFDGKYSDVSQNIMNAIELEYSTNLNPYIIVKVFNTNEDGEDTTKQATKEAVDSGVNIIIGPLLTKELEQVIKITEPLNIPVLSLSNDRSVIADTNNTYLMGLTLAPEIERIVDYVAQTKNAKNFAALVPKNKYGEIEVADLKAALQSRGLNMVKVISYPPNTINFTKYITDLVTPEDWAAYNDALKQYNEDNQDTYKSLSVNSADRPQPALKFDTLFIGDFGKRLLLLGVHLPFVGIDTSKINIIGTRLWGSVKLYKEDTFDSALYPTLPPISDSIFFSKYQSIYKEDPLIISAVAYDTMQMISDLVVFDDATHTLSYDFTPNSITQYKGLGILGNFQLRKDGLVMRDMYIQQISKTGNTAIDDSSNFNYMDVDSYKNVDINALHNTDTFNYNDDDTQNSAPSETGLDASGGVQDKSKEIPKAKDINNLMQNKIPEQNKKIGTSTPSLPDKKTV